MKRKEDQVDVGIARNHVAEAAVLVLAAPVWILTALTLISKASGLNFFGDLTLALVVASWFLARIPHGFRRGEYLKV